MNMGFVRGGRCLIASCFQFFLWPFRDSVRSFLHVNLTPLLNDIIDLDLGRVYILGFIFGGECLILVQYKSSFFLSFSFSYSNGVEYNGFRVMIIRNYLFSGYT